MEDSWRLRMGTPVMESAASLPRRRRSSFADPGTLNPEDFSDVFGGPPRSVLMRKMTGGEYSVPAAGVHSFYEEIFRSQDSQIYGEFTGRGLPAFRIPGERFYSDVFGAESAGEERWKAMSKSNSSSVLSSEDMSPLRPIGGDHHVAFADLSSKLRPLNVGSRRNSSSMNKNNSETISKKNKNNSNNIQSFYTNPPSQTESRNWNSSFGIKYNFGLSRVSSPETISLGPDSYPSVKVSGDESPSSVVSSLGQEDEDDKMVEASSEDDDEMMSSYVIEIGSRSEHREGTSNSCDAVCIDEAIAWAKESFHSHSAASEKDSDANNNEVKDDQPSKMDQDQNMENKHGIVQYSPKMEMRLQDENVRLWSVGKEADIRLLLSTLHYILWNNSGWSAIPLANLISSTQLKKAYQKARLCLHPDKLQQRGATLPQKYIAEKTFSILQDAWSTFTSQDVS